MLVDTVKKYERSHYHRSISMVIHGRYKYKIANNNNNNTKQLYKQICDTKLLNADAAPNIIAL